MSIPRPIVTWSLRIFGGLCLVAAAVFLGLLVFVPLLGLENAEWEREDNPVTVLSVLVNSAVGVGCLWLSRATDRIRFWCGVACLVTLAVVTIVAMSGIYPELSELFFQ